MFLPPYGELNYPRTLTQGVLPVSLMQPPKKVNDVCVLQFKSVFDTSFPTDRVLTHTSSPR
jgi:hypothetical protein